MERTRRICETRVKSYVAQYFQTFANSICCRGPCDRPQPPQRAVSEVKTYKQDNKQVASFEQLVHKITPLSACFDRRSCHSLTQEIPLIVGLADMAYK